MPRCGQHTFMRERNYICHHIFYLFLWSVMWCGISDDWQCALEFEVEWRKFKDIAARTHSEGRENEIPHTDLHKRCRQKSTCIHMHECTLKTIILTKLKISEQKNCQACSMDAPNVTCLFLHLKIVECLYVIIWSIITLDELKHLHQIPKIYSQ